MARHAADLAYFELKKHVAEAKAHARTKLKAISLFVHATAKANAILGRKNRRRIGFAGNERMAANLAAMTSALADEMRDSVVSNAAPIEERESMVGDVDRALAMMGESAREGETAAEPAPAPPTPNGGWLPASVWLPGSSPVGQSAEV